jgi:hypothetical protein
MGWYAGRAEVTAVEAELAGAAVSVVFVSMVVFMNGTSLFQEKYILARTMARAAHGFVRQKQVRTLSGEMYEGHIGGMAGGLPLQPGLLATFRRAPLC